MSTGDPLVFNQGQSGQYLTAGDGITISGGGSWQSLDLNLHADKNFKELKNRIECIEQRLAIVIPNEELQARFPALQEAYDAYKLIEKLVNDQSKTI